jgi:hypothetical protein
MADEDVPRDDDDEDAEDLADVRDRAAWWDSPERRWYLRTSQIFRVLCILLLGLFYLFHRRADLEGIAAMVVILGFERSISRKLRETAERRFGDRRFLEENRRLGMREAELVSESELHLGELWRLTEERLRLYHEIATRQARRSFTNAQWAIAVGFVVVVAGAAAAFFAKTTTISIVVGALSAIGAALAGYIGKTFLRSQENAAAHLRSYFDQPQDFLRYLAAERLIEANLDGDHRAEAFKTIAQEIVRPGSTSKSDEGKEPASP